MQAIRSRIANHNLTLGDRLPSIRSFATTMRVSPSTVVEAYDRLVAEGLIRARAGAGFYVLSTASTPLTLAQNQSRQDRIIDPFWVSRQSLDADPGTLKPGCGWLPPDWMPTDALRRALRSLARGDDHLLVDYGNTLGSQTLRRILVARIAENDISISSEQLLLTASGTQAIDLICRYLLRPGDTVLIDDPCYFNFRALLRAHQANIVSVPYTLSGPNIEAFESVVVSEQPKLYITNSALHNPTGATLSAHTAHRLLTVATACNMSIVEDEIFSDFETEPSPRLAALDGLNHVIRIGSFSKTLSASMRCGYIAARPDWIADLVDLQVATNFGGPSPVTTEIIAQVLSSGGYRKHMETLRRRLAKARRETAAKLQSLGIEPLLIPRGGFYLWCRLPQGCDAADVARSALEENIVLAPGNVFSASQSAGAYMRFNVAHCSDPKLMRVLQQSIKRQ